ncbi:MAG TPA: choice-of-anchor D domain-containing protein, partial [Candidatus Eisenbacteria bacterium]|nr:choice-of-anchor D domain-containing protein [Candidatus Eisenbacteria bacterium]
VASFSATATITSDASNATTTLNLAGAGTGSAVPPGQLTVNPSSEGFGNVILGTQQTQTITLTNSGESSVSISQVSLSGGGFQMSGITAPLTLNPSQSTNFTVAFAPQAAGSAAGAVTITSNASDSTLTLPLSGMGVSAGTLSSSPTSLDFGSVITGKTMSLSETVTNTGGSSVTISQVAASGGFTISGIAAPLTLASGQGASFTVSFSPSAAGSASGNVAITSNASNPTLTIPLAGTGVSPGGLGADPSSISFGSVTVGNTKSLSETVTNTGGTTVTISQVAIGGSGFSFTGITTPVTLTAGQSATFNLSFAPSSAGNVAGNLTVTSNASNPTLTIPLSGNGVTPGTLGANPTSLSFGTVTVGNKQTLSETVTNTGGTSVTISQVTISGSGFSFTGITTPVTLTAGQSATFSVSFTPSSAGSASGNLTITSNASNPTLTIPLSGSGVTPGTLGANPTSLGFGSVTVGNKQSLSETITNNGGTSVTISQVAISGSGFTFTGITTPVTLTAGQSATFNVSFAPSSAGSASGNLTITSNASNPTLTVPLSGSGVTPGTLGANPTSLSFGSVTVGNNKSLSETVTNTGGTSITISQVAISGSGFSFNGISTPVTLTPGQSATFSVSFAPSSAGSASGNLTITSSASNPTLTIPLSGSGVTPGTLGANPTSLGFGSVTVGNKQSLSETITNNGGTSVTISQVAISGSGFSFTGITTPVTLTAGQSATFSVSFAPSSAGSASGNLTVTSNASNPTLTIPLSGSGTAAVGQLAVSPTTMNLGSVEVGSSGSSSGMLTASGASVTVTGASTNNSVFTVGGLTLPVTIPAGQSVSFTVTFSPTTTGAASATLTFTSNAQPSTTTEALTGTGTAAPNHSVNLTWNPSTSQNIAGYNVYRAVYSSSCGSFSKINPLLNSSTLYTDSNVVNGTSYCYATTAVDTSNEESSYSNIVSNVQIPLQ